MRLARIVAVLLLVATACGGGSDDPGGDDNPAAPAQPGDQDPANVLAPSDDDPTDDPPAPSDPAPLPDLPTPPPDDDPPAAEAPDLRDTTWLINEYWTPAIGYTNTWIVDVTIEFGADGTVTGSAGCNTYQGMWVTSGAYSHTGSYDGGQDLVFEDLSWTEIACEDDRVMTQEQEILDVLQLTRAWVLIEGEVSLLDADHKLLAAAETTGRQLVIASSCEGDPTKLEIGVPVQGELTMGADWPDSAYFCVEIPDDVVLMTVTLSDLSADLDLYVAYPSLQALLDGLSDWFSNEFDLDDEAVFIDTGVADYLAPGSYYIEVASGDGELGSFTLTVTTE